jgi:hypothetical protein
MIDRLVATFSRIFMDTKLLDILACPICKGPLKLNADKTELISKGAGLARTLTDDERLDK